MKVAVRDAVDAPAVAAMVAVMVAGPVDIPISKTRKVLGQLKDKERELEQVKLKLASGAKDEADVREIQGIRVHAQRADGLGIAELRALVDQLRDKHKSGVIALGAVQEGKVSLLVAVSKDLVGRVRAGDLIKDMNALCRSSSCMSGVVRRESC